MPSSAAIGAATRKYREEMPMLDKNQGARLANLWDDAKASAMSEPERLLYRSNLLGSDTRITNYGGGNTSAKVIEKDPLGAGNVEVLWVKGSANSAARRVATVSTNRES